MDIDEAIVEHLNNYNNYDVRKTQNARFIDQKITPDVLMVVADCILNYIRGDISREFTRREIQLSDYCKNTVRMIFNKPDTDDPSAEREYNKFFGQPLQMLKYANVLSGVKSGNKWVYKVNNYEILEYVATKDFFAFNFLYLYLKKVLTESCFFRHIEYYRTLYSRNALGRKDFSNLKDRWDRFFIGNTNVNGKIESHRIWAKVLNIFALKYSMPGSVGGYMARYNLGLGDLLYNQINWRDRDKNKRLTRRQAVAAESQILRLEAAENYRIQKAIKIIREKYSKSEIKDKYGSGEATCVHHIFPKNEYPEIAAYLENLIKITVQQHLEKAHPNHKTKEINKNYQLCCLLAKSESIEKSIIEGEFLYSLNDFIYVINTGLNVDWEQNLKFQNIRSKLVNLWSASP